MTCINSKDQKVQQSVYITNMPQTLELVVNTTDFAAITRIYIKVKLQITA
jgi:hypothetical protein